jgi:branched-chain amino acid transport system substrate-binding protein
MIDHARARGATTRRDFLRAAAAVATAGVLGPAVARAQAREIKVGIISAYSGVFAVTGKRSEAGIRLAFAQSKYRDRVKYFIEDSQVKPDVAVQKAQKLVEKDGVDVVVGPIAGHEALAVSEYCKSKQKLMLLVYGGNVKIAGESCSKYTFMVGHTVWSVSAPGSPWIVENLGKDIFMLGSDYSTGRDVVHYMELELKKAGARIVGSAFPPFPNSEWAPYLAQIKNAKPKVVTGFVGGSDLVNLAKQMDEFGLKRDGITMVQSIGGFSDVQAKAMGDAALGHYDIFHWSHWLTTRENRDFLAALAKAAPGEHADDAHVLGYDVGTTIVHGLDGAGGAPDTDRMIAAIEKRHWTSPRGECSFGANHAVVHPLYIRQVQQVGGEYRTVPVKTLKPTGTPGDASGPGGACSLKA